MLLPDYYQILGLSKTATIDDINNSYQKQTDKDQNDKQLLLLAYETLVDPSRRRDYDKKLKQQAVSNLAKTDINQKKAPLFLVLFFGVGVFVVSIILSVLVVSTLYPEVMTNDSLTEAKGGTIFATQVVQSLGWMIGIWLWAVWILKLGSWSQFKGWLRLGTGSWRQWPWFILSIISLYLAYFGFIFILTLLLGPDLNLGEQDIVKSLDKQPHDWSLLIWGASFFILPPIFEEIFFRGWLYQALQGKLTKLLAIMVSSLLFGLVHIVPGAIIFTFIMGVVACWLYDKTGDLRWPIFLHMFHNAGAFCLIVFI